MTPSQTQSRIRPWRMLALAAALATAIGGIGSAPAQAAEVTVVGVTVTPAATDIASGFAVLTLDIALKSDVPLGDTLQGGDMGGGVWTVSARRTDGRDGLEGTSELVAQYLQWNDLTRVAGTPTDGVWRASTTVTRNWSGTWRLDRLRVTSEPQLIDADLTGFDVTVDLGTADLPPWKMEAAPLAPVRVVTGQEPWTIRVRVTDRATGTGIPAFVVGYFVGSYSPPAPRLSAGYPYATRADSAGYWARPASAVAGRDQVVLLTYAGRGSRGFSLETEACVEPLVKWQATERTSVSGRTVTVTGNAFPAPSIYAAANAGINLQVLMGARWTTVAGAQVRPTGRYTLAWQAPAAGTYTVRAYKPGGQVDCRRSVGAVLAAVPVTVR